MTDDDRTVLGKLGKSFLPAHSKTRNLVPIVFCIYMFHMFFLVFHGFPDWKPPAFGSDEEDEEAYGYMEFLKWGSP